MLANRRELPPVRRLWLQGGGLRARTRQAALNASSCKVVKPCLTMSDTAASGRADVAVGLHVSLSVLSAL